MNTIYTVGHGAASTDLLLNLLNEASVTVLVDVRSKPYSRWHSQHNRERMRAAMAPYAITYLWRGANLGGFGENTRYEETITEVAELAMAGSVAVLCSEKMPEHCHRRTMLAPDFQARGLTVAHLLHDGTSITEPPPATLPLF